MPALNIAALHLNNAAGHRLEMAMAYIIGAGAMISDIRAGVARGRLTSMRRRRRLRRQHYLWNAASYD